MFNPKRLAWAVALATVTGAAFAGTATTSTAAWGVGEVQIHDPRILDLSGEYDLVGTTHSIHLRIVQDLRGHLITTATVTENLDNVTTSLPMLGGINANGKSPLNLLLAGARRPPRPPQNSNGGILPPLPPLRGIPAAEIRGRLIGDHFHLFVDVHGLDGASRFQADLTPQNPARGAVVSDSAAVAGPNGSLVTTRTITLPSSVHHMRGIEARRGIADRLTVGLPAVQRSSVFSPPPFGMELQGAIDSSNTFHKRKNIVRVGYGNLDSTSGTLVTHTGL